MRWLLALVGLVTLAAAAPVRDWSSVATMTPGGAYLIGNPAAKRKLVEYGSYTCPHCAHFAMESERVLKGQMIRSGSVSLEYHHLVRDSLDLGAAILARCTGPRGFPSASAAVFATQSTWLPQAAAWAPQHPEVAALPPLKQARALTDASGLTALMIKRGLTPRRVDACFADAQAIDVITKMTADAPAAVTYTPSFYLDGEMVPSADWAKLEPILRAKGAK